MGWRFGAAITDFPRRLNPIEMGWLIGHGFSFFLGWVGSFVFVFVVVVVVGEFSCDTEQEFSLTPLRDLGDSQRFRINVAFNCFANYPAQSIWRDGIDFYAFPKPTVWFCLVESATHICSICSGVTASRSNFNSISLSTNPRSRFWMEFHARTPSRS